MRSKILIFLLAILLTIPGILYAQKHSGGQGQPKMKSSMMHANMGMMADITAKIYQILSNGQLNPAQQTQVLDMMYQMSQIMREMSVPHGEEVKKRHSKELMDMRKRVESI